MGIGQTMDHGRRVPIPSTANMGEEQDQKFVSKADVVEKHARDLLQSKLKYVLHAAVSS